MSLQDGHNVFYHFVGSTASSRSHDNLLQRLIMALAEDPAGEMFIKFSLEFVLLICILKV